MLLNQIYHSEIPLFLREFSATDALLRLKSIGMDCGCEYTNFPAYKHSIKYNRYEHSLGTALIIWHFSMDMKQSVAGLLHDISTPVFSHSIDFLNNDYLLQESTEEDTEKIIYQSGQLMQLLKKYAISLEEVCNYHIYPIADNNSPKLSADRLEYSFRKFQSFGLKSLNDIISYYSDLIIGMNEDQENEIMFTSSELALDFSLCSLKNSINDVSDDDRFAMKFLADILHYALNREILTREDLYTTESQVISKLMSVQETRKAWEIFRNLSHTKRTLDNPCHNNSLPQDIVPSPFSQSDLLPSPGWITLSAKKRYINPYVQSHGRIMEISDKLNQEIQKFLDLKMDYWITATTDIP